MMTTLERRERCLKVALRAHSQARMRMQIEDIFADFMTYVGSSDSRLIGLEMVEPGRMMEPMLRQAQFLANLLEPPAPPKVERKAKGSTRKRG
jgi:hypothetical protein